MDCLFAVNGKPGGDVFALLQQLSVHSHFYFREQKNNMEKRPSATKKAGAMENDIEQIKLQIIHLFTASDAESRTRPSCDCFI